MLPGVSAASRTSAAPKRRPNERHSQRGLISTMMNCVLGKMHKGAPVTARALADLQARPQVATAARRG